MQDDNDEIARGESWLLVLIIMLVAVASVGELIGAAMAAGGAR
jgi:hypothetical protein